MSDKDSVVVPLVTTLSSIYPRHLLPVQESRHSSLRARFESLFRRPATFVARSPGRVNVIGEHIDYSLYPVLPMAISADALLVVAHAPPSSSPSSSSAAAASSISRPNDGPGHFEVHLANVDSDRFHKRDFTVSVPTDNDDQGKDEGKRAWEVGIDAASHDWSNYFRAGMAGALAELARKRGRTFVPRDLYVLVDGSVPTGAGLSSSSALVSASVLAVLFANGETEIDRMGLAELAIVSERAVGVYSGGMDQSASVLSEPDAALLISFHPSLSAKPVRFPRTNPELVFLIAQTFVTSDKHTTGSRCYNLRVVECALAAAWLHAASCPPGSPLPRDASPLGIGLRGFHEAYFSRALGSGSDDEGKRGSLADELEELLVLARTELVAEEGYTREEVAAKMGTTVGALEAEYMTKKFPVDAERFMLRQRAMHVFGEALRVQRFMDTLSASDATDAATETTGIKTAMTTAVATRGELLGGLMNASHASLRDLYDCSHPALDRLCELGRTAGAYGSRLTGAGWGGCTVHLVPADRVGNVRRAWEEGYYSGLEGEVEGAVVESRPGSGSAVILVG